MAISCIADHIHVSLSTVIGILARNAPSPLQDILAEAMGKLP